MSEPSGPVAFVLGGGGRLGAAQVGMLGALTDAGIVPDLVVGTSIGALNGAVFARRPHPDAVTELRDLWAEAGGSGLLNDGVVGRLRTLRHTRVALHRTGQFQELIGRVFASDARIEDLAVPFACVAACIETAAAHWFDQGPLVPALLASSAVPGLFEPVEVDGRHYLDGGLVDSIPLSRAIQAGARTVFVLQVGRVEHTLPIPSNPLEVAQVAFEIARRHRFTTLMADLPDGVDVHVLPSGGAAPEPTDLVGNLRYRDTSGVDDTIAAARAAAETYLAGTEAAP
jgi:NTE family protein